jgi:hypothetical protein
MLFHIFIGQLLLGGTFSVFVRDIGRVKYLSHWIARFWVRYEWIVGHSLNVFKCLAVGTVG